MMSLVYHCKELGKCRHFPRDHELVAVVRSVKLEEILELTSSFDRHWTDNRKVKVIQLSRSTTVGDVVVTPLGAFRFSYAGWEPFSFKSLPNVIELLRGRSSRHLLETLRDPTFPLNLTGRTEVATCQPAS